jgi:heme exporter protein D
MIQEIISMNGYGVYVWSAFSFTMIAFVALYNIVKVQYLKEQRRFNYKFLNLVSVQKQSAKKQETFKGILANINISKI